MSASGLAMTAKHFPGLGRVTGNTDTSAGVTDTVTTRTSADITPFRAAITAGARLLMVSSAYYRLIDASRPAVFSPTVIGVELDQRLVDGALIQRHAFQRIGDGGVDVLDRLAHAFAEIARLVTVAQFERLARARRGA